MTRLIVARELAQILVERGIVPRHAHRVIIDIEAEQPVKVYYTVYGDERLLEVFQDPAVRIEVKEPEA